MYGVKKQQTSLSICCIIIITMQRHNNSRLISEFEYINKTIRGSQK